MKLNAFRIRNYRSIVDTGWIKLAPDNITTLIGQNESGKTSVLEALFSFSNGIIDEDILRSDLSLPSVSCEFSLSEEELENLLEIPDLADKVSTSLKSNKKLFLTRKWISKSDNVLQFGNDALLEEYRITLENNLQAEGILETKANKAILEYQKLTESLAAREIELKNFQRDLRQKEKQALKFEKLLKRRNTPELQDKYSSESGKLSQEINSLQVRLSKLNSSIETDTDKRLKQNARLNYSEKFLSARKDFASAQEKETLLNNEINYLREDINDSHYPREKEKLRDTLRKKQEELQNHLITKKALKKNLLFQRECLEVALSTQNGSDIESRAWDVVDSLVAVKNLEETGRAFFSFIPEFTLFEDFSSLLPNRIDLDDILAGNDRVEGYNAARNFLIVSGLDANFFRESNSRILKQRIENLNGEITLHFQGYWRQNLGRNNKIMLNFELEHYDFNHPEKKGKPYLEFWIKDENERLYPKQRSRGVRWFLSFYLELKATAIIKNQKGKILLIDEPGLSLHARAQEDVLQVFEDLKKDIQVIYSTHSPHLVNTNKLYRLLAVQRADELDDRSETRVFDSSSLFKVSSDTLSPVYTLLGAHISESDFIRQRKNLILENSVSFYYLKTLFDIFSPGVEIYFLPATSPENVSQLVNLLTGWQLHYNVILFGNKEALKSAMEIKSNLFRGDEENFSRKILQITSVSGPEDLFSTLDFKKFVLRQRTGITESNLEYIEAQSIDRTSLAASFALHCQNNNISSSDFDEETSGNITEVFSKISSLLS